MAQLRRIRRACGDRAKDCRACLVSPHLRNNVAARIRYTCISNDHNIIQILRFARSYHSFPMWALVLVSTNLVWKDFWTTRTRALSLLSHL